MNGNFISVKKIYGTEKQMGFNGSVYVIGI